LARTNYSFEKRKKEIAKKKKKEEKKQRKLEKLKETEEGTEILPEQED
jgi:hypothetical protein